MKTIKIVVPVELTYTLYHSVELNLDEEDILDEFQVNSIDDIDPEALREYLADYTQDHADVDRETAANAFYTEVLNNATDFEIYTDEMSIEIE